MCGFEGLTGLATLLDHQLLLIPEVTQKVQHVGANTVSLQDLQGLLPINSIVEVKKNDMQCLLFSVCDCCDSFASRTQVTVPCCAQKPWRIG